MMHSLHALNSQPIILAAIGGILLLFGRRLFWLFVGALGFVAGLEVGKQLFHGMPHGTLLIAAIILGLIGIALAIFLQKFAIGLAGFIGGAYLTLSVLHARAVHVHQFEWLIILIGGLIGLMLMIWVFEWMLIVSSSCLGANLVVHSVHALAPYALIAFAGLAIIGILIQAGFRLRRGGKT